MASFITFDKIAKKVNNKNLLANLSFGAQKNEILFILGKTGSGRSTLFKILMGIISKDKGKIFIDGMDYDKRKDEICEFIAYLPQENIFDKHLNIFQNLCFYAELKGMELRLAKKELIHWANIFGFSKYLYMQPNQIPFEYLRIISIARCLLTNPKILLLDNPTLGMNFIDKELFWKVINESKNDKTILCISQDFEEIESYGDRILILNNGSIDINSSVLNIKNVINPTYRYQFVFKKIVPNIFLKSVKANFGAKDIISRGRHFEFSVKNKAIFFKIFQAALDYDLVDLKFDSSQINELFLKVTNDE